MPSVELFEQQPTLPAGFPDLSAIEFIGQQVANTPAAESLPQPDFQPIPQVLPPIQPDLSPQMFPMQYPSQFTAQPQETAQTAFPFQQPVSDWREDVFTEVDFEDEDLKLAMFKVLDQNLADISLEDLMNEI